MDVVLLHENHDDEIAVVLLVDVPGRPTIGVNLWDVKGFKRKSDGHSTETYIPV